MLRDVLDYSKRKKLRCLHARIAKFELLRSRVFDSTPPGKAGPRDVFAAERRSPARDRGPRSKRGVKQEFQRRRAPALRNADLEAKAD